MVGTPGAIQWTKLMSAAETFWVDIALRNPLDVEVTLSGLTVSIREASAKDADTNPDFVEVEVVDDIVLGAKDTRMVSIPAPRILFVL